jgi:hypothetical protein
VSRKKQDQFETNDKSENNKQGTVDSGEAVEPVSSCQSVTEAVPVDQESAEEVGSSEF